MNEQNPNRIVFWIVRDTFDKQFRTIFGNDLTIRRAEVLAYREYANGTGYFDEGYSPNIISGDPSTLDITGPGDVLKYRLGSIIWDARIELMKSNGLAADPTAIPNPDFQEVDDVEYETKGDKWSFNVEVGIWEQVR